MLFLVGDVISLLLYLSSNYRRQKLCKNARISHSAKSSGWDWASNLCYKLCHRWRRKIEGNCTVSVWSFWSFAVPFSTTVLLSMSILKPYNYKGKLGALWCLLLSDFLVFIFPCKSCFWEKKKLINTECCFLLFIFFLIGS